MQPVLIANGLVKQFETLTAVNGVNLTVHAGEIVGLLGPNGAGKTTALRMLAGILTPTTGRVSINGLDLHANPLAAKQHIGFLSGDTQLYQRLTPREVLRYFGRLYGMAKDQLTDRIDQLTSELEMGSFADRPCQHRPGLSPPPASVNAGRTDRGTGCDQRPVHHRRHPPGTRRRTGGFVFHPHHERGGIPL
jgi:ABC-type multidrug transport system ATPase subunit